MARRGRWALIQDVIVAVNDERHAGEVVVFGFADGQAVDVEAPRGQHPSDQVMNHCLTHSIRHPQYTKNGANTRLRY